MAYQWTPDLETGNAIIDGEHKQLIAAINQLLEACSKGQGRTQLSSAVNFLQTYTHKHFSHEEQLQMESGYPDRVNHKRYHETFCKVVEQIGAEFNRDGPTVALVAKVNTQIGGWLLNHIKTEDVKVATHIKNHKK